jgi:hypothetical protein
VFRRRDVATPATAAYFAAAFFCAFFTRRGTRALFFGASFGIFGFGGVFGFTPAMEAILPAADPIAFAVLTNALSSGTCSAEGFFFVATSDLPSTVPPHFRSGKKLASFSTGG